MGKLIDIPALTEFKSKLYDYIGKTSTPTEDSEDLITSGGVYDVAAEKADKSATVSTINYDSTNKKITKTINGTTSDVVTVSAIKSALGSFTWGDLRGQ